MANRYLAQLNNSGSYYDIKKAAEENGVDFAKLPYTIRILLENVLRTAPEDEKDKAVKQLLDWDNNHSNVVKMFPSRIILQDYTGVPCIVDLASMRTAAEKMGIDPEKINPKIPVDLVIDHSVQVDKAGNAAALAYNIQKEFKRNAERYRVLKWAQKSFKNFQAIPPDTGIIHQINLEYLSPVVQQQKKNNVNILYPDSVLGTDSHTTMINGLGVLGWGVGGIEAEACMLGEPSTFLIPPVVGVKLTGKLPAGTVATDLALTITNELRKHNVVGKFVEYFGDGYQNLSLPDRATISNMSPEYGATCGYFPIDDESLRYLKLTNRSDQQIKLIEDYAKANGLFYDASTEPQYSTVITIDLSKVTTSVAGPKRPQDLIKLDQLPSEFGKSITAPEGNHGFGLDKKDEHASYKFTLNGKPQTLNTGDVLIAAITSCTNTSNPSVLVGAGLLAKNAVEKGMKISDKVKRSFAPGSQAVKMYIEGAGLMKYFDKLGFNIVGFGCTTCIGNSGPLAPEIEDAVTKSGIIATGVVSGNRNFEGRISPYTQANYLASPILVVAYALAGNVYKNFDTDPVGKDADGNDVYLKDIWPSTSEINEYVKKYVTSDYYKKAYSDVFAGTKEWNNIDIEGSVTYPWDKDSTYIANPPYFDEQIAHKTSIPTLKNMRVLAKVGDSVTTDHISPAGVIPDNSPAGKYLQAHGIKPVNFNSYGSRRGNHNVMVRGTLANIRLHNELANGKEGGYTNYLPDNIITTIFEASQKYQASGTELLIIAGKDYGMGSSRDWAAKGVKLLGVKAVIAKSFERIHRSNLVMMGVVPLQFEAGQDADSLGLTGHETYDIDLPKDFKPKQEIKVTATDDNGKQTTFNVVVRFDSQAEIDDFYVGGILNKVLDEEEKSAN